MLKRTVIYLVIVAVFTLWTSAAHEIITRYDYIPQELSQESSISQGSSGFADEIREASSMCIIGQQPRTGPAVASKPSQNIQFSGSAINGHKAVHSGANSSYKSSNGHLPRHHLFASGRTSDYYILALRRLII